VEIATGQVYDHFGVAVDLHWEVCDRVEEGIFGHAELYCLVSLRLDARNAWSGF
jgi:hypothetical protein